MKTLFGIFIILHGLVHLLYFGQSARYFEMQPGMVWPDGSWVFSNLLGEEASRTLASVMLVLAAVGFAAGGVGILADLSWWRPVLIGISIFSSLIFILFWDGGMQQLDNKGCFGILINLAIFGCLIGGGWPIRHQEMRRVEGWKMPYSMQKNWASAVRNLTFSAKWASATSGGVMTISSSTMS